MPQIDRDGVRIHYEVSGTGPAILLTHGFSASSHMFCATATTLARTNTVITWDIRGHGASDYPADPAAYSTAIAVDDMAAVLDAAGAQRAVVAGHSLGGYLSLSFHLAHPERVVGLVLIDTGPGYRNPLARQTWNDMAEGFAVNFERRGLAGLGDSDEVLPDVHRDATGLVLAARGILKQRDAAVIESLPGIAVPTLVVVGENDRPFLDGSRYMANKIPGAELAVIPGAGHAPNISNPAEFDRRLAEFLGGIRG